MSNKKGIEYKPEKSDDNKEEVKDEPAMILYENPEKKYKRRLGTGEYMPKSSDRILLSGLPGSGKRVLILNIINRINPKYLKAIHIVHSDVNSIEYDCLGELGVPIYMYTPEDMPTMENIEDPDPPGSEDTEGDESDSEDKVKSKVKDKKSKVKDKKSKVKDSSNSDSDSDSEDTGDTEDGYKNHCESIIIIDECPTETLGKMGKHRLERIVNHCATHKNCLVFISIQNLLNIPPNCRRGVNNFALYQQADLEANKMASSRAGIPFEVLRDLMMLCKSKHDFIYLDLDRPEGDPWRYRLNFFYPIEIISPEEDVLVSNVTSKVEDVKEKEKVGASAAEVIVDTKVEESPKLLYTIDSKGRRRPIKEKKPKKIKARRIR